MPATNVYGVKIGDLFQAEDGEVVKVVSFITPEKHTQGWVATLDSEEELLVSDLLQNYRRLEPQ